MLQAVRERQLKPVFVRALGVAIALVAATPVTAQEIHSGGFRQQSGEAIYRGVCQGCHMPDARGAIGAGAYPALARNPHLEVGGYVVSMVVNGHKAMPAFGAYFSDVQVANVANYVRTHFGNRYSDSVKPADVANLRPGGAAPAPRKGIHG